MFENSMLGLWCNLFFGWSSWRWWSVANCNRQGCDRWFWRCRSQWWCKRDVEEILHWWNWQFHHSCRTQTYPASLSNTISWRTGFWKLMEAIAILVTLVDIGCSPCLPFLLPERIDQPVVMFQAVTGYPCSMSFHMLCFPIQVMSICYLCWMSFTGIMRY